MRLLGAVLLSCLIAAPAGAHPHAWIDLRVRVLFDEEGRVTGLRESWLFDDFYTAFALEGLGQNKHGRPTDEALERIGTLNLTNLREYDYFTEIRVDGEIVAPDGTSDPETDMVGNRLRMTFTVDLAEPLDLAGRVLDYMIFDPTYYIEMLHAETFDAVALVDAPAGCDTDVVRPNPTFEMVSLAAAIDLTQTGPQNLGALFAETVTVTCS